MTTVTIYTRPMCPYCAAALSLLKKKKKKLKIKIAEKAAGFNKKLREEMIQRSNGGRTYPQIFIGDTHIGGCDDMMALDHEGKLDALLTAGD